MYVDRCVFVDGAHVYAGPHCPHDNKYDEAGLVPEIGWTVQQS